MCRRWIVVFLAIGCGGGGAASVDGGMPDARDASIVRDLPPAAAPTCSLVAPDPRDLCGGAAGCVRKSTVGLKCSARIDRFDFALVPDGRALVALTTDSDEPAAFLLEVPPAGEAKVWPLGSAATTLVAAGADGAARVLLWSPDRVRLVTRAGDSFTSRSVTLPGAPLALAVGAGDAPLVLSRDAGGTRLTRIEGAAPTSVLVTSDRVSSVRLFVDAAGAPTIVYAVTTASERVHRRWTAGTTAELRRVAAAGDDDTAAALLPDGRLRLARTERGSLLVFGDGVMERPVYQAPSWTTPMCAGFMVAYYPDVCPIAVEGDLDVGEHVRPGHALVASASGALFTAVSTAHVRVGCAWRSPDCIETKPCDCNKEAYERFDAPLAFQIRPVDGTSRAWTLLTPDSFPRYAVDRSGAHHLVWASLTALTLATFELRAP